MCSRVLFLEGRETAYRKWCGKSIIVSYQKEQINHFKTFRQDYDSGERNLILARDTGKAREEQEKEVPT
jgi:hypothetical protein